MLKNFRSTPARTAIFEVFHQNPSPISAKALLNTLARKGIRVNKTTIYRELAFLSEKGFIDEVILGNNQKYFESTKLNHHHHLVCTDCGTIEDVFLANDLTQEQKRIESEKKFKIQRHSLEFFGLCVHCQ